MVFDRGARVARLLRELGPKNWYSFYRTRPVPLPSFQAQSESQAVSKSSLGSLTGQPSKTTVDKWTHYFGVYDEILGDLADKSRLEQLERPLRVLEIGVWKGGSLDLWRKYLGPEAIIFGVDINPDCATIPDLGGQVRIGSQTDAAFLRRVVSEMGGVDVVIDDGSHVCAHVIASFETLFPLLPNGGIYIIEDLHTSYWQPWGGGLRRKGSSVEYFKSLVDVIHSPYFRRSPRRSVPGISHETVRSVRFFDSIAVIDKEANDYPTRFTVGGPA